MPITKNRLKEQGLRLRDLARQTLEAYRNLNEAAAEAAFSRNGSVNGTSLERATEILEEVVAGIKQTGNGHG